MIQLIGCLPTNPTPSVPPIPYSPYLRWRNDAIYAHLACSAIRFLCPVIFWAFRPPSRFLLSGMFFVLMAGKVSAPLVARQIALLAARKHPSILANVIV
jgi:hypothetical protein